MTESTLRNGLPKAQGLYDPRNEHDACGMGFVANIDGHKSHDIILKGIQILINLTHRGACGCDPETGDGAGILIQIPHKFFARESAKLGFTLPAPGEYGVGMIFLPVERHQRLQCEGILERIVREEGLKVLGWRDIPTNGAAIGRIARGSQPYIQQIFVGRASGMDEDSLERKLYVVRKRVEAEVAKADRVVSPDIDDVYIPSLSARTIVYKGLLLAPQIANFFPELSDPDVTSALCLVHQRFSTNTFPTWQLAHPFRFIAHNGEINTLRGNVNWMHARQAILASPLFGEDMKKLFPTVAAGGSDSAAFDNVLELLVQCGRSLPHAMAMLIPEAWSSNPNMNPDKKAFYEYHCSLMEPWDGPAAIAFTDGRVIGATLDRNGLRPARYLVTHDGMIVMSSETGVLPVKPDEVQMKGRLQPGKMLLVDTVEGRIVSDKEIKQRLYSRKPYAEWLKQNQITLENLPEPPRVHASDPSTILRRQRAFGYTDEDVRILMSPMAINGEEPIGSMGTDTPLACLSDKPQPLFHYFKQLFAQVTNPPIDSIREEMVMSLISYIGAERNILDETPQHCHTLKLPHPILTNRDLEKLRRVSQGDFLATTLPTLFPVKDGEKGLHRALDGLSRRASLAFQSGYNVLILSDRGVDEDYAPIPSLLALAAVHNHLVREETRSQVALIIESGEPREIMHFALLIGYGASAVNPYLAIETFENLALRGDLPDGVTFEKALYNYIKSVNKGLLKVFSKMGISTLQSYRGAQVFEAIGLNKSLIDRYFTGTASRIEGVGLDVLAEEARMKHEHGFRPVGDSEPELAIGGSYQYRVRGEYHLFNPLTVGKLQHAVRQDSFETFQEYTDLLDKQNRQLCTLR
ncbi:MAG: glutamate synthase subunit alpha, partial [Acidobacteriota bacterium]|nr:glutamate synthase subunit alpha [Acidobacteriota bacterium]